MHKFIISLICCLLPAFAIAATPEIRNNAPDRHIVVKGDTLWGISAMFFKDPWKWPQIWGINKDLIKDPHWIYPGQVIVLDRRTGTLRIGEAPPVPTNVVKLSPQVRIEASSHEAIPSIPSADIAPFLSRPLVIEKNEMAGAPRIVATYEDHVIIGTNDVAYVKNLPEDKGLNWQVYRPGKKLVDPDTHELLGYEATYLGEARVEQFGNVSTLKITKAVEEINKGDRLVRAVAAQANNYIPRAPDSAISARIISIYGGVSEAGQNAIVTINKGRRDGVENGHVLALYHKGEVIEDQGKPLALPDVRYGLLFIFRTFDKVSYGLVMQTHLPVELLDVAQTP
jgi:LysM domain